MSNERRYQQRLSTFAANWRALALRGLVALLFGLVVLFWPGLVLTVLALLFGIYAAVDGAITFVPALRSPEPGHAKVASVGRRGGGYHRRTGGPPLAWVDHKRVGLRHRGVGPRDRRAQDTHRDTSARRGRKRVAAGRKRRPVGALRHTPCGPGRLRRAISSAVYRCLRGGGWPGLDRIRLPIAGAELMTHREPLLLAGSTRSGYPLGDTRPWVMTTTVPGLMLQRPHAEREQTRKTGPKGRCDGSPPRRQRGRPDRRPALKQARCSGDRARPDRRQ